jgi:hypothetical protein
MSEQTETPKSIAVFATEGYSVYIVREPLELIIENYPELEGMTTQEAIDYVESNAWDMKPTNEEDGYDNLAEELNERDIRREKLNNESQEINAEANMF